MATDNTSIGPIDEPDISAEYYRERYERACFDCRKYDCNGTCQDWKQEYEGKWTNIQSCRHEDCYGQRDDCGFRKE